MSADGIFQVASTAVLPGWLLLLLAPGWRWTQRICAVILPLLLAAAYVALFVASFGKSEGGFGSLNDVAKLFSNRDVLLAGWIHYLAFDLFVGAWEVRDARRLGLAHWLVAPCLVLTFLLGPSGLLLYWLLRGAAKKRWFDVG